MLGKALRRFFQEPSSREYLRICLNQWWVRALSPSRNTKDSRLISRSSNVSSQSGSTETTQLLSLKGSLSKLNFPLFLSRISTNTASLTDPGSPGSKLDSDARLMLTMRSTCMFWNFKVLLPFFTHCPSGGWASCRDPSITKRVSSLSQPTVLIAVSLISMLMTSLFLLLSWRKERRVQEFPSCLVFMLMCSRWDSMRLLASLRLLWSGWYSMVALMIRLSSNGYLVTLCRGAMRKDRRFIRRSAVLSFWETLRNILHGYHKGKCLVSMYGEMKNHYTAVSCAHTKHY